MQPSNPNRKLEVFAVSAGSFSFSLVVTFILLVSAVLTKLQGTELVRLLVGREASTALLQSSEESIVSSINSVLGHDLLGRAVVFGVWMLIGLLAYVVISAFQRAAASVKYVETELNASNVDKTGLKSGLLRDVLIRGGIAVLWSLVALLWLHIVVPFFVAAIYVLFGDSVSVTDGAIALAAIALMILSLHIHVVLTRLLAGRMRLFGN